jgi:hypothetical protein
MTIHPPQTQFLDAERAPSKRLIKKGRHLNQGCLWNARGNATSRLFPNLSGRGTFSIARPTFCEGAFFTSELRESKQAPVRRVTWGIPFSTSLRLRGCCFHSRSVFWPSQFWAHARLELLSVIHVNCCSKLQQNCSHEQALEFAKNSLVTTLDFEDLIDQSQSSNITRLQTVHHSFSFTKRWVANKTAENKQFTVAYWTESFIYIVWCALLIQSPFPATPHPNQKSRSESKERNEAFEDRDRFKSAIYPV